MATIGVTGTNGKTSTVTWIAAALAEIDSSTACVTTVASRVGSRMLAAVADYDEFLRVMQACRKQGGRHAAIEVTSASAAAGFLRGWPCDNAVFTNFSRDHLDVHGGAEHYLASKAQLFVQLPPGGTAVLNADDPASELLAEIVPAGARIARYSLAGDDESIDLQAKVVEVGWTGTEIELRFAGPDVGESPPENLRIAAVGQVYAANACAALLGAISMGVPADTAATAISVCAPPPGRFEVIGAGPRVVIDYAHTPSALQQVVETARSLCGGTLTVLFGAGGGRDRGKRPAMGAAAMLADRVILTSDNPRDEDPAEIIAGIRMGMEGHGDAREELDRRRAIEAAVEELGADDVLIVAGRGHETEQIAGETRHALSDGAIVRAAMG